MKKKILLLFLLLLMSGCTATYNLEIDDDVFSESIDLKIDDGDTDSINYFENNNLLINSTSNNNLYYEKSSYDDGNFTTYNFKHSFSMDEYQESMASQFFSTFKVNEVDGYYIIQANDFQKYDAFEAMPESYEINIKTNYNVINNNADKISGNVYTWSINKDNYKNKSIIFEYTKVKKENNVINMFIPIFVTILLCLLFYIALLLINNKKENDME